MFQVSQISEIQVISMSRLSDDISLVSDSDRRLLRSASDMTCRST